MRFLNGFLIPILALAMTSLTLSAPILPNVDSLEARSIENSSVDKRFMLGPTVGFQHGAGLHSHYHQPLQSHQHSSSLERRGFAENPPRDRDGYPLQLQPTNAADPRSANPTQEVKTKPSKRSIGSEPTEEVKHKGVTGRIVRLGKKLARLFYHPIHKHSSTSRRKDEDADEGGDDD